MPRGRPSRVHEDPSDEDDEIGDIDFHNWFPDSPSPPKDSSSSSSRRTRTANAKVKGVKATEPLVISSDDDDELQAGTPAVRVRRKASKPVLNVTVLDDLSDDDFVPSAKPRKASTNKGEGKESVKPVKRGDSAGKKGNGDKGNAVKTERTGSDDDTFREELSNTRRASLERRKQEVKEDKAELANFTPAPMTSRESSAMRTAPSVVSSAAGSKSGPASRAPSKTPSSRARSDSINSGITGFIKTSGGGKGTLKASELAVANHAALPPRAESALFACLAMDPNHSLPSSEINAMLGGIRTISQAREASCSLGQMVLDLGARVGQYLNDIGGDDVERKRTATEMLEVTYGTLVKLREQYGAQSAAVARLDRSDVIVRTLTKVIENAKAGTD